MLLAAALVSGMLNTASYAATDGETFRFGVGFVLLATEQCDGFSRGPKFEDFMNLIRAGARVGGDVLDEDALFARAKGEAMATLQAKGLDLCSTAAKAVEPNGLLVRK